MKTWINTIAILMTISLSGGVAAKALPDKAEIGKGKYKFKNRNEKRASLSMIKRQILYGRKVAATIKETGKSEGKMYVVTRVFNDGAQKFNADIVFLTKKFRGGHSDVVKRFLIGYLEEMFEYERPDARLLAQFILYYNGMFHRKLEKFNNDYDEGVVAKLDPNKVGIHKFYKRWPGNTQIVIPLEKNLLQTKGEKDVPVEEIVKETKPQMEQEIQEIQNNDQPTDQDKKKVVMYKIYLKKMAKYVAKKKKKEQVVIKKVIKKKKKKVQELDDYLVSEDLTDAQKKKLKKEKDDLEKEIQSLKKKADDEEISWNVQGGKIYVLRTNKFGKEHFENRMYIVDPGKDNAVLKSPYNKVCSREFHFFAGKILVIGHHGGGDKHYLTLLHKENLQVAKKGNNPVHWRSPMIIKGAEKGKLWVIEEVEGSGYHLARYNKELQRLAVTNIPISRNSHITFYKKKVYVTGSGKNKKEIQVFSKNDLKYLNVVDSY
jgi:hypothetical protein